MSSDRFYPIGSPLDNKLIPLDWSRLSPNGKRRALVAAQLAGDYSAACRLLAKHGAAVRKYRKEKAQREGRS